jgi:hypothetical protein
VTAGCAGWEPIGGFSSPGEFERFKRWIEERVSDGTAERVPVDPEWRDANPLLEEWFRCRETGQVWRLLLPDPPSRGSFTRIRPHVHV